MNLTPEESVKFDLITSWKIEWLKNRTAECGAQARCISYKREDEIVLKSITKKLGNLWGVCPSSKIIKLTSKDHGIQEIISHYPFKVYFDIDKTDFQDQDRQYLNQMLEIIKKYFPDARFAVSGSVAEVNGKYKSSYHVILSNYVIHTNEELACLRCLVQYLNEEHDKGFDKAVYTKNRCMKCINQSKGDGRIQSIIYNDNPCEHFITCFIDKECNPLPDFSEYSRAEADEKLNMEIRKIKNLKKLNVSTVPVLQKTVKLLDLENAEPLELLSIVPFGASYPHEYTHRVARFAYHNGLSFEDFYSWYQQKSTELSRQTKWQKHWSELNNYPNYNIKVILIQSYPKLRSEYALSQFVSLFDKPENQPVEKIETVQPSIFESLKNKKCIVLNIGMSAGKTEQTIRFLNQVSNFLWITPNVALSNNTNSRINEQCVLNNVPGCKHYQVDYAGKKKNKMSGADKLIVCMNSIHYLAGRTYDYIIIDESETCMKNWINNSTFDNNKVASKVECWETFISLMRRSKNIICIDAFTSNITLDLLNGITESVDKTIVFERGQETSDRTFIEKEKADWQHGIIRDLKNGKKLFIFYPYLNMSQSRARPSMSQFKDILEAETNTKGIMYNSQVGDDVVKTLFDVNNAWRDHDFVLTNTKITVGVNYDNQECVFDRVYILIAPINSARDILQVSYRCRKLNDTRIRISYDSGCKSSDFQNDIDRINDPIYKKLFKNVVKEKFAPLRESVEFFCQKAGYGISKSESKIANTLKTEMDQLFRGGEEEYPYDKVPDINGDDEVQEYQARMYSQTATLEDKLALQKYFFRIQFVPGTDLTEAWSGRYFSFFNKLEELTCNPMHLIKRIAVLNEWRSALPSDQELNKVKLDSNIIEDAFNQITFKSASKTSSHKVICKRIFNTLLDRSFVQSKQDGNNNYEMYINEEDRDMFQLGLKNLWCFQRKHKSESTGLEDPFDD